ncbi:MAG: phosphodiester glycosidase family protein [Vampirovibrionales bacterium]|nr:phosphodiester glycosidase family protein [Vampirovibrionales bacterium]
MRFFKNPKIQMIAAFLGIVIAVGIVSGVAAQRPPHNRLTQEAPSTSCLNTERHFPQGTFYYWRIARNGPWVVRPVFASGDRLQRLEAFVAHSRARAAINGGYFDPANGQTTSFVLEEGQPWQDPRNNKRLTDNPALKPYLPSIFNRSEFRLYACATGRRYDIAFHDAPAPEGCTLQAALGAGPQLAPDNTAQAEAFIAFDAAGKRTRDPLGVDRPNARSLIGITPQGDVILGLFTQSPQPAASRGFTLTQASALMQEAGAERVMALDGGGSSAAYYDGRYYYGKLNAKGQVEKRALKSILAVVSPDNALASPAQAR